MAEVHEKHSLDTRFGDSRLTKQFSTPSLKQRAKTHETFKRDGYDVFVDVDVPFTMAALGGKIKVPTIQDTVTLKVRAGTQPNTMIRLKGKGVKHAAKPH